MIIAAFVLSVLAFIFAIVAIGLCCFLLGRKGTPDDMPATPVYRAARPSRAQQAQQTENDRRVQAEAEAEHLRAMAIMRAEFPEIGYEEELIAQV